MLCTYLADLDRLWQQQLELEAGYDWDGLLSRLQILRKAPAQSVTRTLPETTVSDRDIIYHIHGVPCDIGRDSLDRVSDEARAFVQSAYRSCAGGDFPHMLADHSTHHTYQYTPYVHDGSGGLAATAFLTGSEICNTMGLNKNKWSGSDKWDILDRQEAILAEVEMEKREARQNPGHIQTARNMLCALYQAPAITLGEISYLGHHFAFFTRSRYFAKRARKYASSVGASHLHLLVVLEREFDLKYIFNSPESSFWEMLHGTANGSV